MLSAAHRYLVHDGLAPTFKHVPSAAAAAGGGAAAAAAGGGGGGGGGLLAITEDRYGGVEVNVREAPAASTAQYAAALAAGLAAWRSSGKQGVWLKVPTPSAAAVPVRLSFPFSPPLPLCEQPQAATAATIIRRAATRR